MLTFLTLILIAQVSLFHVDEYYFHRKRKVNRSEVISALVDAGLYIIPLCLAMFMNYESPWREIYITMAALSCISIAKNEIYYPGLRRKERLVHSFMYVLHPIVLYTFYLSWAGDYFNTNPEFWIVQIIYLGVGVRSLAHQVIYWNYIYDEKLHESD